MAAVTAAVFVCVMFCTSPLAAAATDDEMLTELTAQPDKLSLANNAFGLSLYKSIVGAASGRVGNDDNVFLCPVGVTSSLSMVYLGARSQTRYQLQKAMHLDKFSSADDTELKSVFRRLLFGLDSATGNSTLRMANRLYGNIDNHFVSDFIGDMETYYGAALEVLDFSRDAEGSRQKINDWVASKTEQKIKDLLAAGSVSADTAMVVVSAVYFKGLWMNQFDKHNTRSKPFHVSSSETLDVKMMEINHREFQYLDSTELSSQVLKLDYSGGKISMVVFLPRAVEGLSILESSLTGDVLQNILSTLSQSKLSIIDVSLPKFTLRTTTNLKQVLKGYLGVVDLFDMNSADLSGIGKNLFVSDAIHKAFVKVDEEGSEAAGASAVVITMRSMASNRVVADRPFLFVIVHNQSAAVLFIGRVVRPTADN